MTYFWTKVATTPVEARLGEKKRESFGDRYTELTVRIYHGTVVQNAPLTLPGPPQCDLRFFLITGVLRYRQ